MMLTLFAKICEGILMPLEQALVLKDWIKWFKIEEVISPLQTMLPPSETLGMIFTRFPFQKLSYYEYQKEAFSQQILKLLLFF